MKIGIFIILSLSERLRQLYNGHPSREMNLTLDYRILNKECIHLILSHFYYPNSSAIDH